MKKNRIGMIMTGLLYVLAVAALLVLYWFYIDLPEAAYMFCVSLGVFVVFSLFQFFARRCKVCFGLLLVIKHAAGLFVIGLGLINYVLNMDFEPIYRVYTDFLMTAVSLAAALLVPALAVAEAKAAFGKAELSLKAKWWQCGMPVLMAGACVYAAFAYPNYAYIWPVVATFAVIVAYICQLTLGSGKGGLMFASFVKYVLGIGGAGLMVWFNLDQMFVQDNMAIGNIILLSVAGVAAVCGIIGLILELRQIGKASEGEVKA